jgi:hypothetical protein
MVPAEERLPRPEGIAETRRVVVGVGDDDLAPSAGGGSSSHRDCGEPGIIGCPQAAKISSS